METVYSFQATGNFEKSVNAPYVTIISRKDELKALGILNL